MVNILQQVLNALQLGSVYALICLGYTMVYGVLRLINFAHGDVFMVACYVGFFATTFFLAQAHLTPTTTFVLGMMLAMMVTALLAVVIERVAYRPLRNAPRVSAVITALGVGIFLENFTLATLGPQPRQMPPLVPMVNFNVGGVV
ncbi:MAG: branched-chain amino acid ABC transporter permease, partial [Bacillota bacterium]